MEAMTPMPKHPPLRSPPYRKWLRGQPCILTGMGPCDGHHVKLLGNGGLSIKPPDTDCIPIIHRLHLRLDSPGHSEVSVFGEFWPDLDRDQIRNRLRRIADEHWARWEGM